ncbi:acylphosphate phosphohydrolase [Halalkalibacter wakoensis JCM 9140]|uniref:acylphosphatase n=1 Tax=Halalkalibacter wakoensis JCM 9140 TaxID=1236970 RepID=W4Q1C0_9BACI|nr:acylphosphatase [Halalkalibacter wakoensis]GAE25169.1 acylphosphate phosphohydrolase [Halalkalibacter wakoensis JCM 9140]
MVRYQAIVHGRVQGVGFRYFTQHEALKYNIHGTVRNLENGSVEIDAEGSKEQMAQFFQAVQKGPMFSKVTDVLISEKSERRNFSSFSNI